MPVSVTSARISAAIPDALSLDQTKLNQITAGAKAIKVNHVTITLPWASIQTARSTWSWTAADRAVNTALAARLGVTIILDGPRPSWASNPINPAQFAAFANKVAMRYRRVTEFQVWNYPNIGEYWAPAPDAPQYVDLLRAAHQALKKVNQANVVVFGSLQPASTTRVRAVIGRAGRGARARNRAPSELSPQQLLKSAYVVGAKAYFDALAYTTLSLPAVQIANPPAPSGDSIKQSDDLRQIMVANRDANKKIHWTAGYDTDTGKFTQTQQSLYLDTLRWFAEVRRDHVSNLTVHTYRDQD